MVQTIKFSQFNIATLNATNQNVGLSGGNNARIANPPTWTIATRPVAPVNGFSGFNTDLEAWEFWNGNTSMWVEFASSGASGTVTSITAGTGLTGGTITVAGTIGLQVPVDVPLGGSGLTALTPYAILCGGVTSTGQMQQISTSASMGWVLTFNSMTSLPTFQPPMSGGFTVILAASLASTAPYTVTYNNGAAGVGATLTDATGTFAPLVVDGVTPTVGERILFKDQTSQFQNGIYSVTTQGDGISISWVATRTTDYNTPAQIQPGTLVPINLGAVNMNTSWLQSAVVTTIGTDPIIFSQFTFNPSTFLKVANNLSDVANPLTSFGNISPLTTKGDLLGFTTVNVRIPVGTTNGQVLQVNSVASAGLSWSIPSYPMVSGTARKLLVSNGTNILYTTELWAVPGAAGQVLTSDGTNWISAPPVSGGVSPFVNNFRITLTSGVPVTTTNVTGATTWFVTPYQGNQIALFNGSAWTVISAVETSIAVPNTANTNYDIFGFNNSGTLALEVVAWSSDTMRSIALSLLNGVYVKSTDNTRKYLGSGRTGATLGQTEDSLTKRWVFNNYNRVKRPLSVTDPSSGWTYSASAWRQANGNTANQFDIVIGLSEDAITSRVYASVFSSTATFRSTSSGIGIDISTANSANVRNYVPCNNAVSAEEFADYTGFPGIGRHTIRWLEMGAGADTQTWNSSSNPFLQTGMVGECWA